MIKENLNHILKEIPASVTLVAVSKTKPTSDIMEAYDQGHRVFGENKVQELTGKFEELPKDIEWHLIGHLQRNKVKYIAPFVSLIHAVDSLKLLKEINKQAAKNERVIDCLLQFHIAEEDTKFGLELKEAHALLISEEFLHMENVRVVGLMGMATFTDNQDQIRKEFKALKGYFELVKENHFKEDDYFNVLSMGMSGDYSIAIEEGSNMIRVGSKIFGERNYQH